MKTYKKTIEAPMLEITYDPFAENPRNDDYNVGYFFTKESRNISPDGTEHPLYACMIEAEEHATSTASHIQEIKRIALNDTLQAIIAIYPIVKTEHGNVTYRRGTGSGFDTSNCGFYIVTTETLKNSYVEPADIEEVIDMELAQYTQWCNGDVYSVTLYDEDGEIQESCGELYGLDRVKEGLPKGWEDETMSDYFVK